MLMSRKSIRTAKNAISKENRRRMSRKYPNDAGCNKQPVKKASGDAGQNCEIQSCGNSAKAD